MEKIRRFAMGALFVAVIGATAACGRSSRNAADNTTASQTTTAGEESTSDSAGLTESGSMESTGDSDNSSEKESGGVLRDMVDGVKEGMDDMTDGAKTSTGARDEVGAAQNDTSAGGSGTAAQ